MFASFLIFSVVIGPATFYSSLQHCGTELHHCVFPIVSIYTATVASVTKRSNFQCFSCVSVRLSTYVGFLSIYLTKNLMWRIPSWLCSVFQGAPWMTPLWGVLRHQRPMYLPVKSLDVLVLSNKDGCWYVWSPLLVFERQIRYSQTLFISKMQPKREVILSTLRNISAWQSRLGAFSWV